MLRRMNTEKVIFQCELQCFIEGYFLRSPPPTTVRSHSLFRDRKLSSFIHIHWDPGTRTHSYSYKSELKQFFLRRYCSITEQKFVLNYGKPHGARSTDADCCAPDSDHYARCAWSAVIFFFFSKKIFLCFNNSYDIDSWSHRPWPRRSAVRSKKLNG